MRIHEPSESLSPFWEMILAVQKIHACSGHLAKGYRELRLANKTANTPPSDSRGRCAEPHWTMFGAWGNFHVLRASQFGSADARVIDSGSVRK